MFHRNIELLSPTDAENSGTSSNLVAFNVKLTPSTDISQDVVKEKIDSQTSTDDQINSRAHKIDTIFH